MSAWVMVCPFRSSVILTLFRSSILPGKAGLSSFSRRYTSSSSVTVAELAFSTDANAAKMLLYSVVSPLMVTLATIVSSLSGATLFSGAASPFSGAAVFPSSGAATSFFGVAFPPSPTSEFSASAPPFRDPCSLITPSAALFAAASSAHTAVGSSPSIMTSAINRLIMRLFMLSFLSAFS